MTPHVSRRAATDSDRPFVEGAMRAAYADLVERVAGRWDDPAFLQGFAEKWAAGGFEVVEVAGEPAGALWVSDEGAFLRLREVFLLPEQQGRGVGTTLVRDAIGRARRAGKPLCLRVVRGNRAIGLYRRLGFRERESEGSKLWMELSPDAPAAGTGARHGR